MTLSKKIFSFVFCLALVLPLFTKAQDKDTLIIIPLGNSQLYSQALNGKVKTIDAGAYFLNLIDESGQLYSLTDYTATFIEIPSIKDPLQNIKSGDIHSVVVYSDSTLNQFFVTSRLQMFYPEKLTRVASVASGPKMSLAINAKSIMYTWGPKNMVKKLQIPLKTYGVKTAALGEDFVAFINIKNKVFLWGNHSSGKDKIPVFKSLPVSITCGDQHAVVLDKEGNVYAWGNNLLGQCNVPSFSAKVKTVQSKKHRTLAVTENNEITIWGMNEQLSVNYSALGNIKLATLGTNFAAIVVSTKQNKIDSLQKSKPIMKFDRQDLFSKGDLLDTMKLLAKDSLLRSMGIAKDSNFIRNYLSNYYSDEPSLSSGKNNRITIINDSSYFENINSSTRIIFEGEGNDITIINRGVHLTRKNVNQVIVIKGSKKKYTIYNDGVKKDLKDLDLRSEINLDEEGQDNLYPEEYVEKKQDQVLNVQSIALIDFNNLPNSYITEFPVSNGNYWYNGSPISKVNNCSIILEEAPFWEPFEGAQAQFHCSQNALGLKTLIESDSFHINCKLALFEIYYYGLFGIAPDQHKATQYYNEYLNHQ